MVSEIHHVGNDLHATADHEPMTNDRPSHRVWWAVLLTMLVACASCGSTVASGADDPPPTNGYALRAAAQLQLDYVPRQGAPDELWGRTLQLPLPAPDFQLTATTGSTFDFARDVDAPVTLVYFGYTSCPDVCPAHLAALGKALSELTPDQRAKVDVLFVSVDPTVDTPERLRSYLAAFDREITGLTGTPEQVNDALASLALPRGAIGADAPEPPQHPSSVLGYTSDGRAHVVWPFGTPPNIYLHDLRLLTDIEESDRT
jgi:protein SCO1/2